MAPLFSIVTVTLNCVEDAVRTARSVLEQSYSDYEYIVKDGGSTDGTVERVRDLGIPVLVSEDSGVYDAFNQALSLSNGSFIYFLNAGDTFYEKETLNRIAQMIDQNTDICCGNYYVLPMRKTIRNPERIHRSYLYRKNINHQSWMASRELYEKLDGFDVRYSWGADQDFLMKAILEHHAKYQHIDVVFAEWSYGGISTRRENSKAVTDEMHRILKNYYSRSERALYYTVFLHCLIPVKRKIFYLMYRQLS